MGKIHIYMGTGHGKTPAALGEALMAANVGRQVVIIQFMKGNGLEGSQFQRHLEPEIKVFHFEKSEFNFMKLPEEKQKEEIQNIRNGLGYAKKVLKTGECDLLILDEVLGLVENGIISEADLRSVLDVMGEGTDVILTGICMSEQICAWADTVSCINQVK